MTLNNSSLRIVSWNNVRVSLAIRSCLQRLAPCLHLTRCMLLFLDVVLTGQFTPDFIWNTLLLTINDLHKLLPRVLSEQLFEFFYSPLQSHTTPK